jgi:hypothetical protein
MFGCHTSQRAILAGETTLVEGWYNLGGLDAVFLRLRSLGDTDLARQQVTLQEALRSHFARDEFKLDTLLV